jgi:quinol monooxygenase YgiN
MEKPEDFASNADGSKNEDYCCYCYENGAFFYPEATMDDVIESCLPHVVPDVFADEATARAAMREHFPTLKCWKKTGMIISFKLKDGVTAEDFLAASDKIQENYISKCKGFISRQLMIIEGIWTDWVIWETFPDAENSMHKSEENEFAKEFILMIGEIIDQRLYPLERSY